MLKKVIPFLLLVCVVVGSYVYRAEIKAFFFKDTRSINKVQKTLLIRGGLDMVRLSSILEEEGIVKSKQDVLQYAEENQLMDTLLSPGKYLVLPQTRLGNLVSSFVVDPETGHGVSEMKVNVSFNYCRDIYDMASNISKCIESDSASLIQYITSEEFLKEQGVTKEQLPSLFLVDDYEMYFDLDSRAFMVEMLKIYHAYWNDENLARLEMLPVKTPSEVATLGSIVYSESSRSTEEWPIIAGLYLNRLKTNTPLQSDPTFKFCWGDKLIGVEDLTYKHRDIDCPYNTYLYNGLPPGPICFLKREVLDAVLNAEKHDYIFMMAKPGGEGHNFARTNREHEKNRELYRKWRQEVKNRSND
ncbi:MAG: endolytic transglycosylase MltG [Crocinitomicaceae bacterium]